ncbi:MAG: hypothetical protein WAN36_12640 [Calditrichia bacterium]
MKQQRRKSGKMVYRVKKQASAGMAVLFVWIFIFALILLLSASFILYQYKNVKIRQTLAEISQLEKDILILNAENVRLEKLRIQNEKEVPAKAASRLGMYNPVEKNHLLIVEKDELSTYEAKDQVSE